MIVPARSHVLLTANFQLFSQPANFESMIFRTSRERWDTVDGRDPAPVDT